MLARVNGGTGAGRKRAKHEIPKDSWPCGCGQLHGPWWSKCPDTHPATGPYTRDGARAFVSVSVVDGS